MHGSGRVPEPVGGRSRAGLVVANEFAAVEVALDRSANGPRLALVDLASGSTLLLDPLDLEALISAGPELGSVLDDLRARSQHGTVGVRLTSTS